MGTNEWAVRRRLALAVRLGAAVTREELPAADALTLLRGHRSLRSVDTFQTIVGEFRYEFVRQIYEGGMGIVFEALQHGACEFRKRVAIKIIRDKFAQRSEFLENFAGEARLVADLIHTNIVQTYHFGEFGKKRYICMELIRGVNLEQFMQRLQSSGQELPVDLAVFIVSRIARGLAYAHAKTDRFGAPLGIVHRDINPKNILIAFEGDVKLTDFGVAKARGFLPSNEGDEVAGKPEYMSPEQADFQQTDHRSDLFSSGIVLSELLTHQNIFRGQNPEDSRNRVLNLPIPNFSRLDPRISKELNEILQKVLERDLTRRIGTSAAFLQVLEHYIYSKGLGPTSETLGTFVRDLFPDESDPTWDYTRGGTVKMSRKRSK